MSRAYEATRVSDREGTGKKKETGEFVFLPSNLFGLLSLASRVFDNNGPQRDQRPRRAGRPDLTPVKIVAAPCTATRGRFRFLPRAAKFIYLVNRLAAR